MSILILNDCIECPHFNIHTPVINKELPTWECKLDGHKWQRGYKPPPSIRIACKLPELVLFNTSFKYIVYHRNKIQ